MKSPAPALSAAYAHCRHLAKRHYENFPTASYLVPRDKRDALAAIYAFARFADDVADEPGVEGRLEKLAEWRMKLHDCYAGKAEESVLVALHDTIERFNLSRENFENLLRAFESDVLVKRHPSYGSLLAYCRYSANPVGRLVLELFDHRDLDLFLLSDEICTALQLTNFWQDVAIDLERDRIYLPLEDMKLFNYTVEDLRSQRTDDRWGRLMALEVSRAQEHFDRGISLPEKVAPELRVQLRLTWLAGTSTLRKIETARYDVFHRRPTLGLLDFVRLYLRARHGPLSRSASHTPTAVHP
jgi:squalene synthase HpnC